MRQRFTKWYVRQGYMFDIYNGFRCPWWVRPLLIFFSPSYYIVEFVNSTYLKGFEEGLKNGRKADWISELEKE